MDVNKAQHTKTNWLLCLLSDTKWYSVGSSAVRLHQCVLCTRWRRRRRHCRRVQASKQTGIFFLFCFVPVSSHLRLCGALCLPACMCECVCEWLCVGWMDRWIFFIRVSAIISAAVVLLRLCCFVIYPFGWACIDTPTGFRRRQHVGESPSLKFFLHFFVDKNNYFDSIFSSTFCHCLWLSHRYRVHAVVDDICRRQIQDMRFQRRMFG